MTRYPDSPPLLQLAIGPRSTPRQYVVYWYSFDEEPRPLSSHDQLKTAVRSTLDRIARDNSSPELNKLERFFVWNTRYTGWNAHDPDCWFPLTRTQKPPKTSKPERCAHGIDAGYCDICDA